jgi:rhodanese-related sulfurtransferase
MIRHILLSAAITAAKALRGGLDAWRAAGFPLEAV